MQNPNNNNGNHHQKNQSKKIIENTKKLLSEKITYIKVYLLEIKNKTDFQNLSLKNLEFQDILEALHGCIRKTLKFLKEECLEGVVVLKKKTIFLSVCTIGMSSAILLTATNSPIRELVTANKEEVKVEKLQFPSVSINGQRFATSGKEIERKLNNYDFNNNGEKVVYLTFDDGPSKQYSPEILDILKKYNIRATFFTTGTSIENGGEEAKKILQESYAYGNSIGNHSYSHDYSKLYPGGKLDLNSFENDFNRNLKLLQGALGKDFNTSIIRCPGGFNSWKGMDSLRESLDSKNISSIDWNALSGDSTKIKNDPKKMYEEAISTSKDKNLVVLLMHETNKHTPEYLEKLIKHYHENGYEFKTIA